MGKLYRSDDKMIAGVCAGIAENFGFDVKLTRIIALLCIVLGGLSVWLYVILWLLMPVKGEKKSYAERMKDRLENKQ
ncbi:MAG: PspC domain-containing protein [Bacteroidaceae bacterium]|nr:PspC domain-containing protein [Bacteroidaceae bacterium]MBQ3622330.1 PspC domain-containing protein [Bacteroidaceae bacterium]